MAVELSREGLTELLMRNDKAVGRALVVLLNRQTQHEQQVTDTIVHNGIGFTSAEGRAGTLAAKSFLKNGELKDWQLAYWRKPNVKGTPRIAKYWRQLADEAAKKAQLKNI